MPTRWRHGATLSCSFWPSEQLDILIGRSDFSWGKDWAQYIKRVSVNLLRSVLVCLSNIFSGLWVDITADKYILQ